MNIGPRSFSSLSLTFASLLALSAASLLGCSDADSGTSSDDITDVPQTAVERQSIGNCWIYAHASWVESMHLAATGEAFDTSQSYWSYWNWFDDITGGDVTTAISTGGDWWAAVELIGRRGLMAEADFIPEDTTSETSTRQLAALDKMNAELKSGRLASAEARSDARLVRQVLDEAWRLTPEVRAMLDKVFGADGTTTFDAGASAAGTPIHAPDEFAVTYTKRDRLTGESTAQSTNLEAALGDWSKAYYPAKGTALAKRQRDFQIRVQRALHDRQPIMIAWQVDFNAMESSDPALRGSFNLTTLKRAGRPGSQGGHMTVLEDYQATTVEHGLVKAGQTLDPANPEDQAKLDALLLPSTQVAFFRIKNSWGALRDDRAYAPGFPGYHDLYVDYLNGPIAWCPDATSKTAESCTGKTVPFEHVVLPPGY